MILLARRVSSDCSAQSAPAARSVHRHCRKSQSPVAPTGKSRAALDARTDPARWWLATLLLLHATSNPILAIDLEAEGLDGRTTRGALVNVTPNLTLLTPDGEKDLTWAELLSVRPLAEPAPASQPATRTASVGGLRFTLADLSSFDGRVVAAATDHFSVELPDGQPCRLEIPMLRAVVALQADSAAAARVSDLLQEADATADAAVVARGGEALTLRGSVKHIDAQRALFSWNDRDVALPWPSVVGIVFARPAARSASSIVHTRDGQAFAGRVSAGSTDGITLQSAAFENLALPWTRIERIDCRSQKLIFLSDLTPARYDFEPFFDKDWPYAVDRTLSGRPLRLGERTYNRGLTMHSKSTLVYRLAGEFRLFAATAGICDEIGRRGAVTLRVLGDDRVLWEERVRGGEAPLVVLVSVSDVAELSLQVDFDEDLDLGDHACWAFARLIK